METWDKPISSSHHRRHPSFSSSLLDQIYRSIDDTSPAALDSTRKKKHHHHHHHQHRNEDREISPVYHRRSVAADFERSSRRTNTTDFLRHSNSSSSDSSGGGFSSSESDSFYGRSKSSASPPPSSTRQQQPKPIRTSTVDHSSSVQKPKELGGFLRTKSKALKIYSDLKKVKQPISPGGRLATFLNSLFTNAAATNPKKQQRKKTTSSVEETVHSSSTTTCSSASSFSRSCLSKTPSSSGKSKRSVRFCPVNVILDEDSTSTIPMPYAYNNRLYGSNEAKRDVMEEHRRVIEAAKDLLRTYHNKNKVTTTTYDDDINITNVEDDDDALSCASSDLFELENLSAIGIERYREELPVYETTRLDNMNRAIATGLLV
ncbi:PREDICTED: protein BIG GRAIN 1-like A [Camelina sativa]|uniref:Protein BIG GRAIN 1-like A n=1 Tax=Camelina sativa TaxID=90675 RepID=A0ABM0W3S2_CAMSA|nr:PREDICTED: protein BIG GRAIN 1-like A [Camelina sativa]